jgi:hypothetical protein
LGQGLGRRQRQPEIDAAVRRVVGSIAVFDDSLQGRCGSLEIAVIQFMAWAPGKDSEYCIGSTI